MLESHLLFVYGSLLKGEINHDRLSGATCLGRDRLDGAQLLDGGQYPMLVLKPSTSVWGECYQISGALLTALDAFEEHPDVYCRQQVVLASGRAAWTYVGQPPHTDRLPVVAGGDWRSRPKVRV